MASPNFFSQNAPSGVALGNLVNSLYNNDTDGKRAERQAIANQKNTDARLKEVLISEHLAKKDAAANADAQRADATASLIANLFGGKPQGEAVTSYRNAGGMQNPSVAGRPPMDDEGNSMPDEPMPRPAGYTPEAETALNTRLAAIDTSKLLPGKTNYAQMEQGLGHHQDQDIIAQALRGALTPQQQSDVAGARSKPVYTQNAAGASLNQYTSEQDQSGALPQAHVGEINAKAGAETALAGSRNATAANVRANTLPQVQVTPPPGLGITTPTIPARGADVSRAAVRPAPTAAASTVGQETFQDPTTQKTYRVNKRTGESATMLEDGTWQNVNPNELPKNLQKIGNVGAAGARENVFLGRVGLAAGQAARDLDNISKMPLSASSGIFGGRTQGHGLLDAGREVFANKVTGQEAQLYNTRATGFQRNLAAIEAAGLMPNGTLTKQMDSIIWKEGDTEFTKLDKLAQIRQIVDAGLEHVLANPRVSESEKKKMEDYRASMQKSVPYTHADLDAWAAALEAGDEVTLGDFLGPKMRRRKTDAPAQASAAPATAEPTATGPNGEKAAFRNGQWVPLK